MASRLRLVAGTGTTTGDDRGRCLRSSDAQADLWRPLLGDGRPLLFVVAAALLFSGGFLVLLSASRELLPHDVAYLGMDADEVCRIAECRVLDFMVHDRAAFGGTLLGLGVLYLWLTAFPLAAGEAWAWWTWLVSGVVGFLTFLAYLGYGYLDTWHGVGTLLLVPVFVVGTVRSRHLAPGPRRPRELLRPGPWLGRRDRFALGRSVLLVGAGATVVGGLVILRVGVGDTFVPEDLEFMGVSAATLEEVNPRLVPLLAHDRAGFGGGVLTMGLTTALCLWCSPLSRSLHQAVAVAGALSLGAAFVVHVAVGYTDLWHLVPPAVALLCLVVGLALQHPGVPPVGPSAGGPRR